MLYTQNNDYFYDRSKTKDASIETKEDIYNFLENGKKINIIVDCENSNVFKIYGMLKNLNEEYLNRINKILLFDDIHTNDAWDWLQKFIHIPTERVLVKRITEQKSLVDIKMTAAACSAYYRDEIDSFMLFSSDSDFWGLISSLPDANFFVLYEYKKCGRAIKEVMETNGIKHCAIDDFYTGNATDLKRTVLLSKLEEFLPGIIGTNAKELANKIYTETRISCTEQDVKEFYNKYITTLKLKINNEGEFYIRIER